MAPKIQILPETLCNQIAAGEVVERPASVVKELLENSLDSGASEILVEVEKGGKRLLRVVDNGEGMSRDDAFLCLERHATSKIVCDEDLFRLQTLGFRGEALPSIASVSRFTLRTRCADILEGFEIYAEGGTVRRTTEAGMAQGTSVDVRDLFFNTPARRKFLRRDETEIGHIADVVTKLALANPGTQFHLVHNGRSLLEVYRQGTLAERVAALLGRPLLKDLVTVDADGGDGLTLQGFVSQPAASRSSTGSMYTFINGRYIRDRVVQHALMEGYRNLLVKGRYPVVVLFVTINPELVDVNVHPTKHEVRFRDQRLIHDFITQSVRNVLRPSRWLEASPDEVDAAETGVLPGSVVSQAPAVPEYRPAAVPSGDPRKGIQEALESYVVPQQPMPARPTRVGPFEVPESVAQVETLGFFAGLEVLGQYRRSYLVCQDGDDLILIDQHAAHERIGFERLRTEFLAGSIERQRLLFPIVLELEFGEAALLQEQLDQLDRFGFEIEPFGGKSFVLKAIPQLLKDSQAEQLVKDVAAELGGVGKSDRIEEALDDILILMACHGVIRANQTLSPPEIRALLRELDRVDFNAHCPHGRPVMKRLSLGEVERMFQRS